MTNGSLRLPADAAQFVPHCGTMLLIGELRESSPDAACGASVIASGNPFLDPHGRLEGICLVEYLAQLTAASEGFNGKAAGGGVIRSGYLVGVSDFSITGRAVAGDTLQMRMRKVMEFNNVVVAEGDVSAGGERLASGRLKFYIAGGAIVQPGSAVDEGDPGSSSRLFAHGGIYRHVLHAMKIVSLSSEKRTAEGEFNFQNDFPGFDGHFPGNPILPGIVMLAMAKAVAEAACGFPLMLSGIAAAKFAKLVLPGETVTVAVSVSDGGDAYTVRARLSSAGTAVASVDYTAVREP